MRRRTMPAVVGVTGAVAAGLTLAASGAGAMEAPTATVKPITVTVTASDFKYVLSRTTVPKGVPIIFKYTNKGPTVHDWDLEGTKGTAVINPGKTVIVKYTFKKAGTLRYICTVPRHAQFGMDASLTVK